MTEIPCPRFWSEKMGKGFIYWTMLKQTNEIQDALLPLTSKVAEWLALPAKFAAIQTYSPACSALTESMLNWLIRLLVRTTEIAVYFSTPIPFKVQRMSMGKSPLLTVQVKEDISPELIGSSKNSKGMIWGATKRNHVQILFTINNELGVLTRSSCFVRGYTRVISSMVFCQRIYA